MGRTILFPAIVAGFLGLLNPHVLAQQTTPNTPNQAPGGPEDRPDEGTPPAANAMALHWLQPEFSAAQAISQFASTRVQDQRVRTFAADTARAYAEIAKRIESAAPPLEPANVDATAIGEELQDVAERIQNAANDPAATERPGPDQPQPATEPQPPTRRRNQGTVGGEQRQPSAVNQPADPATAAATEVAAADEEEEGLRGRLLRQRADGEGGILQRLRNASTETEGRGSARERLQNVLPVLREAAPEVVDLMTTVIEEGSSSADRQLLELQEAHLRQFSQSVQEELGRYRGDALTQGYLGYATVASLRLEDAIEVARQQAGQQAAPILDDALQAVRDHTRQARKLMEDLATTPTARR